MHLFTYVHMHKLLHEHYVCKDAIKAKANPETRNTIEEKNYISGMYMHASL